MGRSGRRASGKTQPDGRASQLLAAITTATRADVDGKLGSAHLALKFDPAVYIRRSLGDDVSQWLSTGRKDTAPCFLILAPAGSVKTNLFCEIAQESARQRPTILTTGAQLVLHEALGLWGSVRDAIGNTVEFDDNRHNVVQLIGNIASSSPTGFAIVIDAINEYHDPVVLKRELSTFLVEVERNGVHVLISCRDYYWGLFDASWWASFTKSHKDERKSTKRLLGNFSPSEASAAFDVYFRKYNMSVQPYGNALEQFRHPLLLRFFCETYRGQRLGRLGDIRLKDLFDTYWQTKLASIAERMIDQGLVGVSSEIAQYVGGCILGIASYMLNYNKRLIASSVAQKLTHSANLPSRLQAPYGRILDEHIILEELDARGRHRGTVVAFVFEEFMEYSMARALTAEAHDDDLATIQRKVIALTERFSDFSQVFGVVLYLALMLKEEKGIGLWSVLIEQGERWEKVVIEAFKKLPTDQIDDGVFEALIELLGVKSANTRAQALELLKFGRLKRIPPPSLIQAVGDLVTSDDLRIRRRALLALGSCPPAFAIPLIEKAITTPITRQTHAYEVTKNAMTALTSLNTGEVFPTAAKIIGGFTHGEHKSGIIAPIVPLHVSAVCALLQSPDIIIRIGTLRLLEQAGTPDFIPALEEAISVAETKERTWDFSELPKWVRVASGHHYGLLKLQDYSREQTFIARPEVELARKAIKAIRSRVSEGAQKARSREALETLIKSGDDAAILGMVRTMECDEELVTMLLRAGISRRDPGRWQVRGNWSEFTIKSIRSRLVNRKMTKEDKEDLARLLDIHPNYVRDNGVEIGNRHYHHDYWKEYLFRAWGWPPEVKGYMDPSD